MKVKTLKEMLKNLDDDNEIFITRLNHIFEITDTYSMLSIKDKDLFVCPYNSENPSNYIILEYNSISKEDMENIKKKVSSNLKKRMLQ